MTEEELRRLDGSLSAQVKELDQEIKKLNEQIDEIGFFKRIANRTITARSKEKLKAQRDKMEQYRSAIQALQDAISFADPTKRASVDEQTKAYNNLLNLENEINFKDAITPLSISNGARSSFRNTLQALYNRRVGASYRRIIGIPVVVISVSFLLTIGLNIVGLPALVGAITPALWAVRGISFVRGATHIVNKFIRNRKLKKLEPPRKYEDMYPTLSNVKGFANIFSYFRGMRRSVGKRFDTMTDSDLFKRYKTSGFAPVASPEETKGDDDESKKGGKSFESNILSMVASVVALNINNKDEVNKFIDDEFSTLYEAVSKVSDVEIKNRDLLELCNLYLKVVKSAHDGAINETALESLLNFEVSEVSNKKLKDDLVSKLENLLNELFKDKLADSIKEMFENYKKGKTATAGETGGDNPDPEDLDAGKKKKGSEPPTPDPEDTTEKDLTPDKVKEDIKKILDKMSKSRTSVDFAECLKELNELIKKAKEKGVAVTYDEETKMMLILLSSYTSFVESIRSGIYDNSVFYNNLRDFLDPAKEVGSERVKDFRATLINQLKYLVRDELKINDSRLNGLIDYGLTKRSRDSFGTTAAQVALIQNIERFDLRDFSPKNIALARNILDEKRENDRMGTSQNEFYLSEGTLETLQYIEMFSSTGRNIERLSAQIKACQSIISNPAGYAEADARATIENCIKTYYNVLGYVNNVIKGVYYDYTYYDESGYPVLRGFTNDESGIEAAINLKLLSLSQITSLRAIMDFYKDNELRANNKMTSQSQRVDEYLSGYNKARR